MALLLLVLGALSLTRMTVDIFPAIDIPVVVVVWNYPGLSPEDMERRVVLISERAYSTTVNGIQRIESQSIPGVGLLKVYFQPGSDIGAAISQIASVSSTILRITPPGMQPPTIVQFNASNVPVAQLTVSSNTLPEEQIFDYGLNFIRVRLFTIPGLATPAPFGGKNRQIMIDVDPNALASRGLSPADVVAALQSSNIIIPSGTARMGGTEYNVTVNTSPRILDQFNKIPIKVVGSAPVYVGDVARVSDSFAEQTNVVRVNGRRATYLAILKHADASTLAVVDATREALPSIREVAPQGLELKIDFDQSVFVRGAIEGVVREAVLASILVSVMILIFLGSWRSMVVVSTSIPLSIFAAIICLNLAGQSINIMTLGGLALAIGMLVDDATVAVENIHRNLALGKPLTVAVLDGSSQIAVIESPELDRQYEAALVDAQNKRKDSVRARTLVEKGYISQQDADHAEADARMAEANAEALRAQKDYEILKAPFDSTVTARFADPGALVQSAITSQTTTLPVVALSQTNRLRVYAYLDQRDASFVRLGDRAEIYDSARPEVRLPAVVSRVSGELDPKTRTLLTELDLDNKQGLILAGSSMQVSLTLTTTRLVEIPAEALLSKDETALVAVVSGDNKASFRKVAVADSDGKMVRLISGLSEGESVILNPGFGISEGMHVEPVHMVPK
jgi:RND family efflux transporter MFP subunit